MISTQGTGSAPKYQYKTTRRQNRSCDHCRRSKRACDAALSQWAYCSNCLRLGKTCSFESVLKQNSFPVRASSSEKYQTAAVTNGVEVPPGPSGTERSRRYSAAQHLHSHPHRLKNRTTSPTYPLASYFDRVQDINGFQHPIQSGRQEVEFFPYAPVPNVVSPSTWPCAPEATTIQYTSENSDGVGRSDSLGETDSPIFDFSNSINLGTLSHDFEERRSAVDGDGWAARTSSQGAPQFTTSAHYLAEKTNKSLISSSLKHIYSDTLENALLCWVTEKSCPYNNEGIFPCQGRAQLFPGPSRVTNSGMIRRIQRLDRASCVLSERPLTPRESRLASHALHATIMAFAAQWAQLSVASASDLFRGRAGGHGQQPFLDVAQLIDASLFDFAEAKLASFDRSLQVTLWNEAYRALQQAIGIDSFQVAFAQVVFGFTQRPLSREDFLRIKNNGKATMNDFHSNFYADSPSPGAMLWSDDEAVPHNNPRRATGPTLDGPSTAAEAKELLDLDKDPLHLRDSLMRLSARRVKLISTKSGRDTGCGTVERNRSSRYDGDSDFLTDRMTFNQLFWLVMMCDTLSAAINNRLPIVSDEDSVIISEAKVKPANVPEHWEPSVDSGSSDSASAPSTSSGPTYTDGEEHPWGMYFLGRNVAAQSAGPVQWPFSKDTASALLSEAAPVKALLYRKVKQVQNARFRRSSPARIEQAILAALKVYEHWNRNYGDFISTCLKHHDELPVQIQSWYSVLVSHWHLACYLLSDLIEELDKFGESDERHSAIRKSCGLLFHIRKQSAFEMGDLGRVGRVREDGSFGQTNDFHPTVNDGALLTEPWTEIMIRSFARVSEQSLAWLGEIDQAASDHGLGTTSWSPGDFGQIYQSLGYCVEALLDLGRKSDMAFLLAISFKRRMVLFNRY